MKTVEVPVHKDSIVDECSVLPFCSIRSTNVSIVLYIIEDYDTESYRYNEQEYL